MGQSTGPVMRHYLTRPRAIVVEEQTMSGVEGETIIVRGAAKGIGRGEAELLAASRILIRRNAQRSQKAIGVRAVFLCHGVLSATDWQRSWLRPRRDSAGSMASSTMSASIGRQASPRRLTSRRGWRRENVERGKAIAQVAARRMRSPVGRETVLQICHNRALLTSYNFSPG